MPGAPLKPRWKLDSKGRISLKEVVREQLGIGQGASGVMEVYGKDKILLTVYDRGGSRR
jgi:bifunctional DNA-binding transcriptional regulator/antitoxin component of YhaV-PrlF toxin-antitoxin module